MKRLIAFALVALVTLPGCARVISTESRLLVDPAVSFDKLRKEADSFVGKFVMVGGMIANVKNTREGSQLEIVQFRLDDSGTPEDSFNSGGRFLATTPQFLDSMIYKQGRMVTLVGEVKGHKTMPLDEVDYYYPLISIREIYVWKSYENEQGYPYPTPGPYYYDPYYYGYWPGPYWYRPLGPVYRRW